MLRRLGRMKRSRTNPVPNEAGTVERMEALTATKKGAVATAPFLLLHLFLHRKDYGRCAK